MAHHPLALLLLLAPLAAQRELLDLLPGDADARSGPTTSGFGTELQPLDLPGQGPPRGAARLGDRLWIARGEELLCVRWPQRTVLQRVPPPGLLVGLATDGKHLFAASRERLFVLDAIAGRPVHEVTLDVGHHLTALGHNRGVLYVAADRELRSVAIETGRTELVAKLPDAAHWLAGDGNALHFGRRDGFNLVLPDGAAKRRVGTPWPLPFLASTAAWIDGRLLLLATTAAEGEPAIVGLVDPARCLPSERLSLRLHRGDTAGALTCELGPKPLRTTEALLRELQRIAKDPSAVLLYPDGTRGLIPVVIEAYPGVTIAELRQTWDRVAAAGFPRVVAPQQEAWGRSVAQQRQATERAKEKEKAERDKE